MNPTTPRIFAEAVSILVPPAIDDDRKALIKAINLSKSLSPEAKVVAVQIIATTPRTAVAAILAGVPIDPEPTEIDGVEPAVGDVGAEVAP